MVKNILLVLTFITSHLLFAQKKPLGHSVYDSWQSIGERMISNDGKWVVYTINVQEGDNDLVIQSSDTKYKKTIPRGYNAIITEDSRFAIFKIKAFYKDTREARIKKKRPDDFPKDSLAIVKLGNDNVWKLARVKTYKTPEKSYGWIAYHLEKMIESPTPKIKTTAPDTKKITDSLNKIIDSLEHIITTTPEPKKKKKNRDDEEEVLNSELITTTPGDADGDEVNTTPIESGTDLILRKMENGVERTFHNVLEYYFSKNGQKLLMEMSRNPKDSLSYPFVLLYDLRKGFGDTLSRNGNDFKSFAMTDDGSQVAYLAEREAKPKDLQKFYRLWYFKDGDDSTSLLVDKNSVGMKLGMTISEYGNLSFSKSGKRLFFGTSPIQPPKDTTLIDIDLVKLDIWHYNDDYLQTVQTFPNRLRNDLQQNYLAVYDLETNTITQLGNEQITQVIQTNEGDGDTFIGVTDFGKRVESQWLGTTRKDIYAIDVKIGNKKLVKENLHGQVYPSSTGKYIMWYDRPAKNYFVWDGTTTRNITAKIKVPLWNEDFNNPDAPPNYGVMGWHEGDSAVYVYDKYNVWRVDPISGVSTITFSNGRKSKLIRRYILFDPNEREIKYNKPVFIWVLNDITKNSGIEKYQNSNYDIPYASDEPVSFGNPIKAKNSDEIILTEESFIKSPDLFVRYPAKPVINERAEIVNQFIVSKSPLSSLNPQQKDYNWGTAELFHWKAYNGKTADGIVYKPEDFNPKKKYPMVCYFYEELDNTLNNYVPPAPIRSAINISFFVSRGYIIFVPNIEYKIGHPGKSAYDYVVSGAKALIAKGFVDPKNIAIQGHSWGGYQVAYLITATNMFKAAWAGAPMANMTSAYGGIRWESGVSRQFQYEKSQSRIGATLWDKPQLYIENSPLFHLKKVTTPLVIMANDADGAVPWYQGIELFTAMRRLGKKVWMFNYNDQGHGLTQRKDRLDYHIRMQQFFDWILKGDKPAKWITEGVPAIKKGKDWGLEIVE